MSTWHSFSQFLVLEDIMLPVELQSIVHETASCRNRHNPSLLDSWVTHTHTHTHTHRGTRAHARTHTHTPSAPMLCPQNKFFSLYFHKTTFLSVGLLMIGQDSSVYCKTVYRWFLFQPTMYNIYFFILTIFTL